MIRTLAGAVRFFWTATTGNRLRPWRSEYLQWRIETYSGKPAETLKVRDFLSLFFAEPRQFFRFFAWSSRVRAAADKDQS